MGAFDDLPETTGEEPKKKTGGAFDDLPETVQPEPSIIDRAKGIVSSVFGGGDKKMAPAPVRTEDADRPAETAPAPVAPAPAPAPVSTPTPTRQMAPPPQPEPVGPLGRTVNILKDVANKTVEAIGKSQSAESEMMSSQPAAEASAAIATGLVSWIPAGLSMFLPTGKDLKNWFTPTGSPDFDFTDRTKRAEAIQDFLTYKPPSKEGQKITEGLATPITYPVKKGKESAELWAQRGYDAADKGDMAKAKAYWALAGIAEGGAEALPFLFGTAIKGVAEGTGFLKDTIKNSNWYRSKTIKERGLIAENLDSIAAKIDSGDLTGDEIRKLWKDVTNREVLLKKYAGKKVRPDDGLKPAVKTADGDVVTAGKGGSQDLNQAREEARDESIKEGQKQENNEPEHTGTDRIGKTAETGSGDSLQGSRKVERKERIAQLQADLDELAGKKDDLVEADKTVPATLEKKIEKAETTLEEAKVEPAKAEVKFGQTVDTAKGQGKVVGLIVEKNKSIPLIQLKDGKRVRLDTLEEHKPEASISDEEKPQIEAKSQAELLDKFNNTGEIGTEQDLIEKLKERDDLSDPMKAAIMDYDKAVEDDRMEYGMRSGLPEQAAEKVVSLLKKETTLPAPLSQTDAATVGVTKPEAGEPLKEPWQMNHDELVNNGYRIDGKNSEGKPIRYAKQVDDNTKDVVMTNGQATRVVTVDNIAFPDLEFEEGTKVEIKYDLKTGELKRIQGIQPDGTKFNIETGRVAVTSNKSGMAETTRKHNMSDGIDGILNQIGAVRESTLKDYPELQKAQPESSLIAEARKYKTAEEFVKAQGKGVDYSPETHVPKEYFKITVKMPDDKNWTGFVKQTGEGNDLYRQVSKSGNEIHDVKGGTAIKLLKTSPEDIISKEDARVNKKYGELEVVNLQSKANLTSIWNKAQEGKGTEKKDTLLNKEPPGGKLIGTNEDGKNVYERPDGVRYFTDGRIRVTEPVTMAMTRGGVQPEINPDNRRYQWKTTDELKKEGLYEDIPEGGTFSEVGAPINKAEQAVMDSFYKGKKTAIEHGEKQNLTLTAGPAGAGKSTTIPKEKIIKHVHVSADLIRSGMKQLKEEYHERASELADILLYDSLAKGYHTLYDSQLTNYGKAKRAIEKTLAAGGDVTIGMTDIDAETSIVRSMVRDLAIKEGLEKGDPREVPVPVSLKGYNFSLPTFAQFYKDYKGKKRVDFLMTNNNIDFEPAKFIFSQFEGILNVGDKKEFVDKILKGDYIKIEGGNKNVRQTQETEKDLHWTKINQRRDSTLVSKRNALREKRAGLQGTQEVEEADHGLEGRKSGEGTSEDDQAGVEGQGAEDLPPVGKGGKTGSVSKRSRRADDGKLRQRGSGSVNAPAEAEGLSGKPAKSDNGEIPVVGGNSGNLSGLQRPRRGTDHVIEPGSIDRSGSWFQTAKKNLDIIELIKKLDAEKRLATPEEQKLLAQYVGWGASEIANNLFPGYAQNREIRPNWQDDAKWREQVERLVSLLTPEQIATAARSTQYAHYTSPSVITSIHKALARMGFTGGKMVDPGCGPAGFWGLAPAALRDGSIYTGIEFDEITAKIAQYLYPNQNIIHGDYTKQKLPNEFFDIGIGNPPFSSTKILTDPDYKKLRLSLHDYFFVKTLDKIRPGGLLVFISSRYTMDKQSDKVRNILNEKADLMGAIRMPQTAFKKSAGTEVVTDVLFLRKKVPGEITEGKAWKDVAPIKTPEGEFLINEYFIKHPEMVLGTHSGQGSMYGKNEYTVLPKEGDIESAFDVATQNLPEKVFSVMKTGPTEQQKAVIESDFNPANKKEGGLYVSEKGDVMVTDSGRGVPVESVRPKLTPQNKKWLKDYVGLRDAVKTAQYDQLTEGEWQKSLDNLKKIYSDFVKKHGRVNDFTVLERKTIDEDGEEQTIETRKYKNVALLRADVESPLVWALEATSEDGTISDGPFLKGRTIKKPEVPQIKTVPDALAVSLSNTGKLDINDISALIGKPVPEVIDQLGDLIYESPEKGGDYVLSDEYLSGNVKEKLEVAKNAAKIDPKYERNVDALQNVQPAPLVPHEITVNPGSSWIPVKHYNDFVRDVLELQNTSVRHSSADNQWELTSGSSRWRNRGEASQWSTLERGANEIFKSVLNNSTIKVYQSVPDGNGGTKQEIDPVGTAAANDVAKKMRARFKTWVWEDAARAKDLQDRYNDQKNTIVPRSFDGKHLTLPGVSLRYKLMPHQKNAIWRVIQDGNTYIYHAVGAGKTYEMVAAGMEMKRLGLINKPLYIVPNHMLRQFSNEFQDLYPMAHIMVADEENFHTTNRKRFMAQAGLNNPDAIVITHSSYGLLKMKAENIKPVRNRIIAELRDSLDALHDDKTANRIRIKQMEKRIEQVEQRFDSMIAGGDNVLTFEDMGVDFLFVDEAHNFRKLDFTTNRQAKGIDPNGSRRAMDLLIKIKWLETQKPGRSHVFASGTPVTNTMGELYTVMKFFMEDEMEREGIHFFDSWANEYGEMESRPEMNAAGRYEIVERFSKFVNMGELMSRVRTFMDVLTNSQLGGFVNRPKIKGGQPEVIVTPSSPALKAYQDNVLQPRIVISKAWKPSANQKGNPDPMINIITDGRLASIDLRFVVRGAENDPNSKLNKFIDEIIAKHKETKDNIYLDTATGKESPIKGGGVICFYNHGFGKMVAQNRGFDARAWAMEQFKKAGIKASEVAWIDDFDTAAKKESMFKEMRTGTKRILIGSAKKMGTGMNVQTRLADFAYLDPPWYPSDFEQPVGRIVRQGNQNKEVGISLFSTKGSYDSTMWGMVTRKAKFQEDVFAGNGSRTAEDISPTSLYEMAMAISSGDERAIQLAGLNADINNLENLRQNHFYTQNQLAHDKTQIERAIPNIKENIKNLKEADEKAPYIRREINGAIGKKIYTERKEFGDAILAKAQSLINQGEKVVDEKIGEISDLPITFNLWRGKDNINVDESGKMTKSPGILSNSLEIEITPKIVYVVAEGISTATDPVGLVARIANKINGVSADLSQAESGLDEKETNLKKIISRLGAPFEFEAELNEKTAEAAQITHDLEVEANAPAAPPATEQPTGPNAKEIKALQDNINELDRHLPTEKKGSVEYNRLLEVRKGFEDKIKKLKEETPDFPAAPMGLDPTQTLKVLRGLKANSKAAIPYIEEAGRRFYEGGKQTYKEWVVRMKDFLGKLWDKFRSLMRDIWDNFKRKMSQQRGGWKMDQNITLQQAEARARMERNLRVLSKEARDNNISLEDYLKQEGMPKEQIDRLMGYAKEQPSEYEGYREVQPDEVLPPGSEVKMDFVSGKSFVKVPKVTGIKNRVTKEERQAEGKDEVIVDRIRRSFPEVFEKAKKIVDSGDRDPGVMAAELIKKPRPLSAEESCILLYGRMILKNDKTAIMDRIERAIEEDNAAVETENRVKLAKVQDDIDANDEASRLTGYEQGIGLSIRRAMIKEDYSLARLKQRARIATQSNEVPEDVVNKLKDLVTQLEAAEKKAKDYEEKLAQLMAQKAIQRIRNEDVIRKHLDKSPALRGAAKEEIDQEFMVVSKKLNSYLSSLHFMFDPTAVSMLAQMARLKVMTGSITPQSIVDEIFDQVHDDNPEIEKRDIRDAISGYGKVAQLSKDEIDVQLREARRQMRLISAYEDATAGQLPLKSGLQRDKISNQTRELARMVKQAMREAGIDSDNGKSPEEQWKTSLDAVKTRLRNQIFDLEKQLKTGEKTPKKIGIKYDEEAEALKAQRDELKAALETIEGKPQMSPEQKIKMAMAAVEKSINEYERRIDEKDLSPKKKGSTTPETPELKELRAKRDELKAIYKDMQKEAKPKKSPEEIALQTYKTRTANRLKELEEKLANKDYSKKPRKQVQYDQEAMNLKAQVERVKSKMDDEIRKLELANRDMLEKGEDFLAKWRRFVLLSSVTTLGKLTAAATMRQITTPIEELVGGVLSNVPGLSRVAGQAPREGSGLNVAAEAKAISQWFNKQTYKDILEASKTGKTSLDLLYGHNQGLSPEALDFFGHQHMALKVLPKRAEFSRSFEMRARWAINHNFDVTDPVVQGTIAAGAYDDSLRAIFMNDNGVTTCYRMVLNYFEHNQKMPVAGKAAATTMKVLLPIVKVPTNYAFETANYAFGVPKGAAQIVYHLIKNKTLDGIKPDQADNIMRSLKKGSVGILLIALGYYLADNDDPHFIRVGGYYTGERRKATDLKAGDAWIGTWHVPHWLLHTPAFEVLQVGATLRRVQEKYGRQLKPGGTAAGLWAGGKGIAEHIPFMEEPARLGKAFGTPESAGKFTAETVASMVTPPDVTKIARLRDKDEEGEPVIRKPEDAADVFKMGIPGLREQVPIDTKKTKRNLKDKLEQAAREGDADEVNEAKREGKISEKEKEEIKKSAKEDPLVSSMKHLSLEELAKRVNNATEDEKEKLYPVFKKKFNNARKEGTLSDDDKQKYYDILEDLR